jgi:hypothetical protein
MRAALATVAFAALVLPATAAAHGRSATVALDYRLRLEPTALDGVHLRVLDGDRDLQATVAPGSTLVVRGYLHERMIRIGPQGVWVNASSPTAQADKLVGASSGWVKVAGGSSWAWHDHRLAPPPTPTGRNAFPLTVDGTNRTVAVFFTRVPRPALWPWLAGAVVFAAAVVAAVRRRTVRSPLTLALALAGGAAAVLASIAFALRDQPSGGSGWLQIGITLTLAVLLAALLARSTPRRRAHAAGVVGAVAAAGTLSSLPVFWHGVTVSALPATATRLACALALLCGAAAAALSFLPEFDEPVRAS